MFGASVLVVDIERNVTLGIFVFNSLLIHMVRDISGNYIRFYRQCVVQLLFSKDGFSSGNI